MTANVTSNEYRHPRKAPASIDAARTVSTFATRRSRRRPPTPTRIRRNALSSFVSFRNAGVRSATGYPPPGSTNRHAIASPPERTARSAAVFAYTPSTQNTHHLPPSLLREPLIASMKTALYGGDQFDHCTAKWSVRAASRRKRNTVLFVVRLVV